MNKRNNSKEYLQSNASKDKSILDYKGSGEQTIFKFMGIEMTAPSALKNPGIVYISFIMINIFIFFVLKSFISNQ